MVSIALGDLQVDLSASAWDARYQNNDTPWDLSGPTPEFARLTGEGLFKKGRAIIPGGGRGHDAVILAQAGIEVDLVDFAPTALILAQEESFKAKTTVHTYRQNFFELKNLPYHKSSYDYFLEYTFFCAIDPKLRGQYVEVAASMLKSGGLFVGLFFPLQTEKEGPPFLVSREEVEKLFRPYFDFEISQPKESVKARAGREFLMIGKRK